MSEYLKKLADKFFKDECSSEEAERVLDWLETSDGQKYLDKSIRKDFDDMKEDEELDNEMEFEFHSVLNSDRVFIQIMNRLNKSGFWKSNQNRFFSPFFQLAATIIVILSGFYYYLTFQANQINNQDETIEIVTNDFEQRNITLLDGSKIILNSRSAIRISQSYHKNERRVELEGEAFFEVASIPDRPFIIDLNGSSVEVIGTAFNVRSDPNSSTIEVAVTEGKVTFSGIEHDEDSKVLLRKGDYAYWDRDTGVMQTEQFGTKNYIAWLSNEFHFDDMSLKQVCIQLNRFYGIECRFDTKSISEKRLNAQFMASDVNNTLSVIALSLNLHYRQNKNEVFWERTQ